MKDFFPNYDMVVVLDTETTGVSPQHDEIIELGAVSFRRDGAAFLPDAELSCLISLPTGRTVPPVIERITGISQAMLDAEGIGRREAAEALQSFLTGQRMLTVAYNAQFDLSFLYYFLARFGCAGCLRGADYLDALTIYRDRRPYPHKLENAIASYRLEDTAVNSHRAIDDAKATVCLLDAMAQEQDDLAAYINLFGYHPKYGVSGKPIRSITYCAQPYEAHPPLYVLAGRIPVEA